MALVVRRVKVSDLPVLESLEQETTRRFPSRKQWMETFRALVEESLAKEPEGMLIADFDGRAIGGAIVRVRGAHPVTGVKHGRVEALTVAPGWVAQGIHERLLKEAEAYLKASGCRSMVVRLPSDAGADGDVFRQLNFSVAAWDLERRL